MPDLSSTSAPSSTPSVSQAGAATVLNQPGFAALWGLATAKDSLLFWLKTKSFHTVGLVSWLFTIFFITAALNGFLVASRTITSGQKAELPLYSYTTIIVLLVTLLFTKERSRGLYIWSAWIFWISFTLIGFVNPSGITAENYRTMFQTLGKAWICLIGIPWIAFRAISPDQLPRYTNLLIYVTAFGSILCFLQLWYPEYFSYFRTEGLKRAGGTWVNSNGAGMVFMQALLLSRLGSWKKRWVKWLIYLIILSGLIASFSRGAMFSFVAGQLIYLLIVKNYKRILLSGSFLIMFLASWVILGHLVQNNTITIESKEIRDRVQTFSRMFSDQAVDEISESRLNLWKAGIEEVFENGNLLFGLGHSGILTAKTTGVAPHNEYIQFFADGGLFGLTAFLAFLGMFAYTCYACKDLTIRAILMSMLVAHACFCMSTDRLFLATPTGTFFALMVLWAHYTRDYPGVQKIQRLKRALASQVTQPQTA